MGNTNQPVAKLLWVGDSGPEELLLRQDDVVTIGRGETNTIVINSSKVSRNHARVEWSGDHFTIRDLGSSNGTFVNGQRIEYMPWGLRDGDEITLERFPLRFEVIQLMRAAQDVWSVPTVALGGRDREQKPRLIVVAGPEAGKEFNLQGDEVTIGRESQAATWEIRLNDRTISRPHAKIERHGGAFTLFDLGSANGTTLNDLFVIEPVLLGDGDVIGIGATKLIFKIK
jgi:pSer/pThr/pTyr-binding forkhead associated (FHA) protein